MITEKNHKLLTSQLFVTDCTKKGLASMQALSWFCFAHIKQQIVSLFRSDLISVCIFFNIEQILSGSAMLTEITQQALANLDKKKSTRPGIYNCISFSLMSKKEY